MLKLNDTFGLDERIAKINENMASERRKFNLINKGLMCNEQKLNAKITSLNERLAQYANNVAILQTKI